MGIDLHWEDEEGNTLGSLDDSNNHFAKFLSSTELGDTIVLKFIDHFGDTILNQLQIDQLIVELKQQIKNSNSTVEKDQLLEILNFA
jgi:hypothetical protein